MLLRIVVWERISVLVCPFESVDRSTEGCSFVTSISLIDESEKLGIVGYIADRLWIVILV